MLQKTHAAVLAEGHGHESHSVFGFWVYLMTDCILFAALFATFGVMSGQFAGGPTAKELFELRGVALETGVLLVSSLTYGLAMLGAQRGSRNTVLMWLVVTFVLGAAFLYLEVNEFSHLVAQGAGPDRSAYWSSFFALVGTHGLHVLVGLVWMVVLMVQLMRQAQPTQRDMTRLTCLSLFWHFLDIVWICVFSFVYLGSVQ